MTTKSTPPRLAAGCPSSLSPFAPAHAATATFASPPAPPSPGSFGEERDSSADNATHAGTRATRSRLTSPSPRDERSLSIAQCALHMRITRATRDGSGKRPRTGAGDREGPRYYRAGGASYEVARRRAHIAEPGRIGRFPLPSPGLPGSQALAPGRRPSSLPTAIPPGGGAASSRDRRYCQEGGEGGWPRL